jgi:hypothetical protein
MNIWTFCCRLKRRLHDTIAFLWNGAVIWAVVVGAVTSRTPQIADDE